MAFSTWKPMAPFWVTGMLASASGVRRRHRRRRSIAVAVDDAFALRAVHGHQRMIAVAGEEGDAARAGIGHPRHHRIGGIEDRDAGHGLTFWTMTRLTTERSSTVLM
jgi:hypothetical protein